MLYLDNAATSFPKAPGVAEAVLHFLTQVGASAGRSGHRLAREADAMLWETRALVGTLLGVKDPARVVFSLNVTQALNMALMGLLREGDHVVTTGVEHNSVMRPLRHLEQSRGIKVTVTPCFDDGLLDPSELLSQLVPSTRMIVMTHASNVGGGIMPIEEVAKGKGNALLLVDAAQTAGALPIDMERMGIDILAFTGHKALLGPPGVGGLCIGPGVVVPPLVFGGTGTSSESHDHPSDYPLALEAGTHNMAGVAGLRASLLYILARGVENIREDEEERTGHLFKGLQDIEGIRLYGPNDPAARMPVISLNLDGLHPDHLVTLLDQAYGILARSGLHCAPSAHRVFGTFPEGSVRLSPGPFQTLDDMELVLRALREISLQMSR
ncbi:MAG: aminotransferase class V-fold PLP-dependent enzyme [Thermodesulfobacteriota bacterium]